MKFNLNNIEEKIFEPIIEKIKSLPRESAPVIVAIDGRCASGKTTATAAVSGKLGCAVFHMDDFFLRPEQRTAERLSTPGGNVDYERFFDEILKPLKSSEKEITYRPFSCKTQSLCDAVKVSVTPVCIVEGSYSCHPALREYYDLKVFLTVSPSEQMKRIISREGDAVAAVFKEKWIPLEEKYFSACEIEKSCDIVIEN